MIPSLQVGSAGKSDESEDTSVGGRIMEVDAEPAGAVVREEGAEVTTAGPAGAVCATGIITKRPSVVEKVAICALRGTDAAMRGTYTYRPLKSKRELLCI